MLMKVLRRLEPGVSPDVEVTEHLAGLSHVPRLLGTLNVEPYDGAEPRTLALVQEFVPNEGDAWVYTLDELGRFAERVVSEPPTSDGLPAPAAKGSPLELALAGIPDVIDDLVGPFLASMRLLGTRTAQMHIALADGRAGDADPSDPADPAFIPEPMTRLYQRSLYQSVRNAVRIGLRAARKELRSLEDPEAITAIRELAEREEEILGRLKQLSEVPMDAVRIRTHGDFHLGQVLWTGRDVVIIDFEGEPARPLGERRLKRSPLRDVAGMLRSLQYASASTLADQLERGLVTPGQANHEALATWLDWWLAWSSAAFLEGYFEVASDQPFVPDDPDHTRILLDAFLLEKAVYELGYEMNNRPEWVGIPLAGIRQVLDTPER
jgi:maltose alpha-D-glucosyltransferase / alpha-amylase